MENVMISRDGAFNVLEICKRKVSVEDLCLFRSIRNSHVKKDNLIYEKITLDNIECIRRLESFLDWIINIYEIELKEDEEISFDYCSMKAFVKKEEKRR